MEKKKIQHDEDIEFYEKIIYMYMQTVGHQ